MHPVIAQAIVAERSREDLDATAAAGRARQLRAAHSRWARVSLGISRAGRGRASQPAHQTLRGPRPA
jgi:hypothetical protein